MEEVRRLKPQVNGVGTTHTHTQCVTGSSIRLIFTSFLQYPTVTGRDLPECFIPPIRTGILRKSATGLHLVLAVSDLHEHGEKNPARPFLTRPHTEYKLRSVIRNTSFDSD